MGIGQSLNAEMLRDFEVYLRDEEKSNATIEKYLRDLRKMFEYIGSQVVNKQLILAYKTALAQKYEISSANSMIAAMNTFFRFINSSNLCVKQFKTQRKPYCEEAKELTKAEYMRLVQTAEKENNERLSLVIQTICGTGIRVSELCNITIEAVKRGEAIVSCKGKTRTVFIVSALRKKLVKYAQKNRIKKGAIFITKSGKALNRSNIWREMKALCNEANVLPEKVFPHNLRHLFARSFYGIEKDIAKLADILGHSNINTTRIYTVTTSAEYKRHIETMRLIL